MMGRWHILPMSNSAFAELLQLIFAGEIARQRALETSQTGGQEP